MKNLFITLAVLCCLVNISAQNTFTGKPIYQVVTTRGGVALGTFTMELFPNNAYKHTRNFDSLVAVQFFDSLAFHRCIPGFMIQGGSPYSKNGPISMWGQSPSSLTAVPAEFTPAQHKRGIVSAARLGNNVNSATSQFFINTVDNLFLDNNYSIYGRVTNGMNWVDTIVNSPKMAAPPSTYSSMPAQKIAMYITRIGSNDTVPQPPVLTAPFNYTVNLDSSKTLSLKWNLVSDGILYQLQVSRDSLFQSDTLQFVTTPLNSISCVKRAGNTWYFWRVRTNNGGHYSPWSTAFRFHTAGETTGLTKLSEDVPALAVFPVPASRLVHIQLPTTNILLKVLDLQGKIIWEEQISKQDYTLDLYKFDKGVYWIEATRSDGRVYRNKIIKE